MEFTSETSSRFDQKLNSRPNAVVFEDFENAEAAMDFVRYCLSSYSDSGFMRWWNRPTVVFDNEVPMAPIDVWDTNPQSVIDYAVAFVKSL